MKNITVIIYSFNEENNIRDCIASVMLLTDEIIVIDSESTDNTVTLARQEKVIVYTFPHSFYVEPARGYGIEKAKSDWVFILDADERITPKLVKEIQFTLSEQSEPNGQFSNYKISRKNIFGKNKWLRHGGWWPDYQTRLINKKYFKNWPKDIHSTPKIDGETGFLKQPLLHYFHGDLNKMVEKTIIFEDIESELLFKAGRPVATPTFFRKFLAEVNRRLLLHLGFLDGTIGIIEGIYQAFSRTVTYLYLYEKKKSRPL